VLSFLATGTFDGKVAGINQLREQYKSTYGQDPGAKYYSPGDYTPVIPVTYWTFRIMIGLGVLAALGAAAMLWVTRKGRLPRGRTWVWLALSMPLLPLLANSFGWLFTEMGRQPWAVFGLMTTSSAVSPGVSVGEALTSVVALTLVYAVLAVIEVGLLVKFVKVGAEPFVEPPNPRLSEPSDDPLTFAY
jgi:cytochrome bd ubiquinol oxidase subunit I